MNSFLSSLLLLFALSLFSLHVSANIRFTPIVFQCPGCVSETVTLIDNGTTAILWDTSRTGFLTNQVVDEVDYFVKQYGVTIESAIVSHGHPDHFSGVPALVSKYNGLKVYVASQTILSELLGFVAFFNQSGLFPPALASFNWNSLQVLPSLSLYLGQELLQVSVFNDSPSESVYYSVLYHATSRTLLTADVLYNKLHLYLGPGVTLDHARNWRNTAVPRLMSAYPNAETIVCGHGLPANDITTTGNNVIEYLRFFEVTLLTCNSSGGFPSMTDVENALIAEYPTYDAAFISFIGMNGDVWRSDQKAAGCYSSASSLATLSLSSLFSVVMLLCL